MSLPERRWPRDHPLADAVGWLDNQARQIARRDPPANGEDLYLTDHGVPHIDRVLHFACELADERISTSLTPGERALIWAAVATHDLGLFRYPPGLDALAARADHAELSARWVISKISDDGVITRQFGDALAQVVRAHRRSVPLDTVYENTYISEPPAGQLRLRLIAAILRIADAMDMGIGRTPIAIYRYHEQAIPEKSLVHWTANTHVRGCSIDAVTRELVVHVDDEIDLATDDHVRFLYDALQSEVDLVPRGLLRQSNFAQLHVVFEQSGRRVEPGVVYAGALARSRAR